jgi:outer membrane protein OmpA-like peptidoglycan-associated protein
MIRFFIVAATAVTVMVAYTNTAEPCGVKLTVKAPKINKQVKRSANPSQILLLGNPPRKLTKKLSQAGHRVDVADDAGSAKKQRYALVVADPDKVQQARESFPGARIVTRSSSTGTNLAKVERSLGEPARPVVARRTKTRRRPTPARVTKRPKPPVETPAPAPERIAEVDTSKAPAESDVEAPSEATVTLPREADKPEIEFTEEFFFGTNSSKLTRADRVRLSDNARWLKANPGATVTIEGHTDASGSEAYNQRLSEKRAAWVKSYLVRRGVAGSRIQVVGFGEERPAYSDDDSKNRRVVLVKN